MKYHYHRSNSWLQNLTKHKTLLNLYDIHRFKGDSWFKIVEDTEGPTLVYDITGKYLIAVIE